MRHHQRARAHARGFSLLEALIALLVLSFGMLAIAGFQTTLARSSDLAKQRSEATRLAQQKMETLRSFVRVATDPTTGAAHKFNYTDDVVSSTTPETIVSNATFTRRWTVCREPILPCPLNHPGSESWVNVLVEWTDRAGQAQTVQLLSVISKFDPQTIGTVATGPGGIGIRYPKNRNINIPFPVVGLQGGLRSAFVPPPRNVVFVFDNASGDVTHKCTGGVIPNEGDDLLTAVGANCSTFDAYLLSGFVFFRGRSFQVDANLLEAPFNSPISEDLDSNRPLEIVAVQQPVAKPLPQHECFSLAVVGGRFIPYICVVEPIDHDSNAATRKLWSGKLQVRPGAEIGFQIGSGGSDRRVCRFTSDYNRNLGLSNREHPLFYRDVTGALSNQNFLITDGQSHCPADEPSDPLNPSAVNLVDTNTADHQPTPGFSFRCSALDPNPVNGVSGVDCASASKVDVESASTTTLPMN